VDMFQHSPGGYDVVGRLVHSDLVEFLRVAHESLKWVEKIPKPRPLLPANLAQP